ncbi:transporter substrate-binding domain-containing protein [Pseudomonas sp. Bout1]|uniref:transporter substrate-binding domain-containing protein n=1 Tax=Pseudomonas sp. Bout1 TaxID=3048600 RepID=UPI002AB5DD56|nr:transporter substrate-binding domain-containing protein [Pseudomonas sp. Bout1]MDY7530900.1 transporter substrate-binding domain-containing protein [Pseudomonas sp. Bout1]MEB0188023.1 transporter substrate-binding domain-containing protein [Pseudomonas sp. Bout1]
MFAKTSGITRAALFTASLLCIGQSQADVTATPGVLKIGMEITYPPFESYDGDKVVGSDPELITAMAAHLGLKTQLLDTKFPNLIMGLNAGHYDAVISGIYITPERQLQAQTLPYAQAGASILAPKGSELNAKTPQDLCGHKIGLLQGSAWVAKFLQLSSDYCLPNNKGAITVNQYPNSPEVTQALMSRNIEAQVEIGGAAEMIVKRTGGRVMITSDTLIYPQTLGIYVKKGNDATFKALTEALAQSKASGEYAAILKKYNLDAIPD